MPHVVPVGFRYNPEHETIDIGAHDFANRKKYRDVQRNPRVAFVVDDVKSFIPWRVREVEIRGAAEILETGGETVIRFFDLEMFRIRPKRVVSWGLEQNDTPENARTLIPQLIQRLLGRR